MNSRAGLTIVALLVLFAQYAVAVDPLEEIVEQKFDVDADATLSVENIDGSIRVYAADTPAILMMAIKKAYTSERLQGIVVDTKATQKSLTITTTIPPRKNALSDRSGTVDYIIVVPLTTRVTQLSLINGELLVDGLGGGAKAHLGNGWLCGHNCFGDLDLSMETGRIDLAYDWWENERFSVKARSTRGNVRAFLPSDASASVKATAPEGRIATAFEDGKVKSGDTIHSISTVIGPDADATISLEAARGNIRIEKVY